MRRKFDAYLALVRVRDIRTVVIERRHGAHDAGHDRHRVRIAAEPAEEVHHLLVQHRVVGHEAFEFFELRGGGQITIQQQIAHFEIVRFTRKLVDGIAAVQQHAFVAVDIGDRAVARRRRGKARVVGEHLGLCIELANVDHIGACRGRVDRQIIVLAIECQLCGFCTFGHNVPF